MILQTSFPSEPSSEARHIKLPVSQFISVRRRYPGTRDKHLFFVCLFAIISFSDLFSADSDTPPPPPTHTHTRRHMIDKHGSTNLVSGEQRVIPTDTGR